MSVRDDVLELLEKLPEEAAKDVLEFARRVAGESRSSSSPSVQSPRLTDGELEAILAEEEAFSAGLGPPAVGEQTYRWDRDEIFADRLSKAYRQ